MALQTQSALDQYHNAKQIRRQTQEQLLDTVMTLPERARGAALYGLWPQRLPRVVRSRAGDAAISQWRKLRKIAQEHRWEKIHAMMAEQMREEMEDHLIETLTAEHDQQAGQIMTMIRKLVNLSLVTICVGGQEASMNLARGWNEDLEQQIMQGILATLAFGGSIITRQQLALRCQVKNDQGQMVWMHQERVCGLSCGEGQWRAVTEAEMRDAYSHDIDGNPIPRDGYTVFGTFREQARAIGHQAR